MKIFSSKGTHAKHNPKFPKTRYIDHTEDTKRDVWRKYSTFDKWHYEGFYDSELTEVLN